jgi:hypothetical protein
MFNSRYPIPFDITPGENFQNKEIDSVKNRYFVTVSPEFNVKHMSKLIYQPIEEYIYTSATSYPFTAQFDFTQGSFYQDYIIPSPAYKFVASDTNITVLANRKKISLDSYLNQLDQAITDQIKSIYRTHSSVVLSYSGGIDSIVLLSYIMAGGFLSKTTLLTHNNLFQDPRHPAVISNNPCRVKALDAALDMATDQGAKVFKLDITDQDFVDTFNFRDFNHLRCYTVSKALSCFNDTAFLYGHHGNQSLLHKNIFIDQLLLQGVIGETEVQDTINKNDYYVTSATNYNINSKRTPLEHHPLLMLPWHDLSGHQDNAVYSPLGLMLESVRDIDFNTVTLDDILNANLGRRLITKNVGIALDDFIIVEGVGDGDSIPYTMFDRKNFDQNLLSIPNNINHNLTGQFWLEETLKKDSISSYNLLTLKLLHQLSDLHDQFGWKKSN